ncbi:hypothetical protein HPB47_001883 [Ixodes persulcatus]|uniref:Uncharacterized protein n=1 Tax=Ixodes persulcatus TaxID=34615 RepID=A0AC60PMT7_IXOPE|nr:hypothetical protein HPB47_001883 [Ixodes persulcatus]
MRVQLLSFSDVLRDEYKESCPNMGYKNAPVAPNEFDDFEEDLTDSDPDRYDSPEKGHAAGLHQDHGGDDGQHQAPAKERVLIAAMKCSSLKQHASSLSCNATNLN